MNLSDQAHSSIAGIILAAGSSTRMGQPKLLLSWQGETLIHRAARTALEADLDPVILVTGCDQQEIRNAVADLPLRLVHNPVWRDGQSTSVRAGVQTLPAKTQAALFLLGDQPFITPELIQALVKVYLASRPAILAPFVGEQRANPVLFDQSMFDLLTRLKGDAGARTIFHQYPPAAMPWPDERILLDIDTPEDFETLAKKGNL